MSLATLKGGAVDVKLWTNLAEVESSALDQLRNIASLTRVFHHVAVMPDVHYGAGATVGSVIAMKDAVIPAAVGVDIGCVDAETEFLSPNGWKRIDSYTKGEQVLEFDPETGGAEFRVPEQFIDLPADKFYVLKTKYGIDQVLSPEHRVLYYRYDRSGTYSKFDVVSAERMAEVQRKTVNGFRGRFLTTFVPKLTSKAPFSDELFRIALMVAADGHFLTDTGTKTRMRFKKERKIDRCRLLLKQAAIPYEEKMDGDLTEIYFFAPARLKTLNLWDASLHQLKIVADEVLNWDGNREERCFYTTLKESADFVQYAFTAAGYRSVLRKDIRTDKETQDVEYRVFAHTNTKIGINGSPKTPIEEIVPPEGTRKYCFKTSTGFWVMRRGGQIVVTGNCGMGAIKTSLKASQLPDSLKALRLAIEAAIPVGFNRHEKPVELNSYDYGKMKAPDTFASLFNEFKNLHPDLQDRLGTAKHQVGTLGGGNHFIELCLDTDQTVWMMLHSGSRNIGKETADVHIRIAQKLEHNLTHLPDKNLACFLAGTPEMESYRHDLYFCQRYAFLNRVTMFHLYMNVLRDFFPQVTFGDPILCHHNYVSEELHYGEKVFVTRKGAISAEKDRLGIIPGSMGAKSFIVKGKGNPESFNSASHGAGRKMGRKEATRRFTLADLEVQTEGVECRKDDGVLDEIPSAYKDIAQVMANQADLVKIVAELKQVLCVKG